MAGGLVGQHTPWLCLAGLERGAFGGSVYGYVYPDAGQIGSDTPAGTWMAIPRIGRQKTKKPRGHGAYGAFGGLCWTTQTGFLAERVGFEPTVPCGTPDFESGTFGHSATSPCAFSAQRRILAARKSHRTLQCLARELVRHQATSWIFFVSLSCYIAQAHILMPCLL